MFTLAQNKRRLWYAKQLTAPPTYKKDISGAIVYTKDSDGNRVPVHTGSKEHRYGEPVEFLGNLYVTGGYVELKPYGHDLQTFDAMLVMLVGEIPVDENDLLWEHEPKTFTEEDGEGHLVTYADPQDADWRVQRATDALNEARYILEAITKKRSVT